MEGTGRPALSYRLRGRETKYFPPHLQRVSRILGTVREPPQGRAFGEAAATPHPPRPGQGLLSPGAPSRLLTPQ